MINYQIAIPSYKRPTRLLTETLAMLKRADCDFRRVTVFVANRSEQHLYKTALEALQLDLPVVVSEPGLINARVWYNLHHYEQGTPILNLDDDIAGLYVKDGNALQPYTGSLDRLVEKAFKVCEKTGARLWGINPAANGMFLKPTITVGLRYICGIFHGSYAGDPALCGPDRVRQSSGEDFETTLRSYKLYKGVVRVDGYAPKTKYFAEGGIMAELGGKAERERDHKAQLQHIVDRFPAYSRLYEKSGGVTNIKLRNLTHGKINWI
jgi:hypothetical protein